MMSLSINSLWSNGLIKCVDALLLLLSINKYENLVLVRLCVIFTCICNAHNDHINILFKYLQS